MSSCQLTNVILWAVLGFAATFCIATEYYYRKLRRSYQKQLDATIKGFDALYARNR